MHARLSIDIGEGFPKSCDISADKPVTIGRSRDNTITLHDEHASRHHARIAFEQGGWMIHDLATLNGTKLDGSPVQSARQLQDGQTIAIGDTRLTFRVLAEASPLPGGALDELPRLATKLESIATSPSADADVTTLRPDELTAIYSFMAVAMIVQEPENLIKKALVTIYTQTGATIVGFLSLDKDNPLPKMVFPEKAKVDFHLSRNLTQRIQKEGRTVWLGTVDDMLQSDSLLPFRDAMCLPVLDEGTAQGAIHVYKSGKYFNDRDLRFCEILVGFVANCLSRLRAQRALEAENSRLRSRSPLSEKMIGDSQALKNLNQIIERVGPTSSIVLIQGESGSGKELVALALHQRSARRKGPLVVQNCSAFPPSLLEAELFGHVKGAFTGAEKDRPGLFEQADGGTLFLDEIGDLPLECQAKLLRVIENKGFRPLGGQKEIQPDVRVIGATHQDLEKLAADGKYRSDLLFRLCVIRIQVPPLRQHLEDLPALVDYFLEKLVEDRSRKFRLTEAAMERLRSYPWPGNVRQLRAVLENAVVMCDGTTIDEDQILLPRTATPDLPPSWNLDAVEAWAIRKVLQQTNNNFTLAAGILGITRDTLASRRKKHKISADQDAC